MIGRPISPALPHFYGRSSVGEVRMVYARARAQTGKQKPRWFRPRKPRRWSKDGKRHRKEVTRIASQLERRVDYLPPAERRHMAPLFILLRGVGLLGSGGSPPGEKPASSPWRSCCYTERRYEHCGG